MPNEKPRTSEQAEAKSPNSLEIDAKDRLVSEVTVETNETSLELANKAIVDNAYNYIISRINQLFFDRYIERLAMVYNTTPDKVLLQICGIEQDLELTYGLRDLLKDFEKFKSTYEFLLEENPLDPVNPTYIAIGLRDGDFLETYIQLTQ